MHGEPHLPAEPYKGLWLGWGLGGEGDQLSVQEQLKGWVVSLAHPKTGRWPET